MRVGVVTRVEHPESPYAVSVVSVRVENRTSTEGTAGPDRPSWLRHALVAAHQLLEVEDGRFLSLLDPPEWARALAEACVNDGVFPVLGPPADEVGVVLASPIILYDHAELAPQSQTAFFDALEVDELLSLRTTTLSDQEKREVRGTDPRTAALLHQVDSMPDDLWERLHGTVRYLDSMTATATAPVQPSVTAEPDVPWWDPGSDSSVDPERDAVMVGDVDVSRGSQVILRPGVRRADAYDLFLAGRTATVAAVLFDVDHGEHLAVTVDDDPGSDLKASHGRYLYFAPDEVEPIARVCRGEPAMTSVLVACVGNIFKSDDGFGVEVAARLARRDLPEEVRVVDFGIRSVHLVYELLYGYDVLVLVDTVAHQEGPPGSLFVIEPDRPRRVVRRGPAARGDDGRPRPLARWGDGPGAHPRGTRGAHPRGRRTAADARGRHRPLGAGRVPRSTGRRPGGHRPSNGSGAGSPR